MTRQVRDCLDVADSLRHEGEALTPGDLDFDEITDTVEMLLVWQAAKTQEAAAIRVARVAGEQLASLMGKGGVVVQADSVIRYKQKLEERCTDPKGLMAYATVGIADGSVRLEDVVTASAMKRTWMSEAVRDTFHEWVDKPAGLTVRPKGKAPKWIQALDEGTIIEGEHDG